MGKTFEERPAFVWSLLCFRVLTFSLSCWLCHAASKLIWQTKDKKQQQSPKVNRPNRKTTNVNRTLIMTLLCILFFTLAQFIAVIISVGLIIELSDYQANRHKDKDNDGEKDGIESYHKQWVTVLSNLVALPALIGFDFLLIVCVHRLILTFNDTQYQVKPTTVKAVYTGLTMVVCGQIIGLLIAGMQFLFKSLALPIFLGLVTISTIIYLTILIWIVRRFYQTTKSIAHSISTLPKMTYFAPKPSNKDNGSDNLRMNHQKEMSSMNDDIPNRLDSPRFTDTLKPAAMGNGNVSAASSSRTAISRPRNSSAVQLADSLLDAAMRVSLWVILPLTSSVMHCFIWLLSISVCYHCYVLPPFLSVLDLLFNSYCMLCTFESAKDKYFDPLLGWFHRWLIKQISSNSVPQLSKVSSQSKNNDLQSIE